MDQRQEPGDAGTTLRVLAAIAIIVGGLTHLQLYFDGYRDVPNANLGRSFLLNAFGSALVAIALLARRDVAVRIAGMALAAGTLIAFWVSRTDRGVFGFSERGFRPSPQATLTVVVEVIALLALAATFVPVIGAGRALRMPVLAVAAAVVAAGTAVMSVLWNQGAGSTAAAGEATVAIADFEFGPPEITVAAGSTVTWTNADGVAHTVDAEDDSFVSDSLGQGAGYSFTFLAAGTFAYICGIHPSMSGTVVVTE